MWRGSGASWRTSALNERPVPDGNPIPAYHASITPRYTYVEYGTGEKELYDRSTDPYELRNIARSLDPAVLQRFQENVSALENCSGYSCRVPEGT